MKRFLLIAALAFSATTVQAAVTFGASVTNANGTLSTTLSWNAPGASGCTASGHPSWTGTKAASGTLALPSITMSGSYTLTLSCTTPGNAATTVTWIPPTQNTDGSALTNLAGYRVVYGRTAAALDQVRQVAVPAATNVALGNLASGQWFFGVIAYNANGVDADLSNMVTKTVTGAAIENASVTLTVNPIPRAATGAAVQ